MITLRAGTRGSDLALWQTGFVSDLLRAAHVSIQIERVIIKTHGDVATDQQIDKDWPVGGFVGALELALVNDEVDFAVHSYKDLPTAVTAGLVVAATPRREVVHDVLVTRKKVDWGRLPRGFRLGTSSPRRAAQFRRLGDVEVVPIRGNVPTRIRKLETESLDGVVLAAAGLKRLRLDPPHRIDLPTDRFVPAPAQGALAVQTRDHGEPRTLVEAIDHAETRRKVEAERGFLRAVNAGCHVPIGALAQLENESVTLCGQLFSDDGVRMVEGVESGNDPVAVGERLAARLLSELGGGAESVSKKPLSEPRP